MAPLQSKTKFNRLLLLVISSTVIAEVLSGSTTLSRIQYLPTQFFLYGSAVILIREISRRLNAGWPTILLLGLAFGLTLEGLVLQSVFNPSFLTNDLTFGRSLGTNWVWVAYMPGFHAFGAITTPILLCEVYYNDQQPWASNLIVYISAAIFALICIAFHFLFIKITHFTTTLLPLAVVLLAVILIILIALRLRRVKFAVASFNNPAYSFWLIAIVTFIAGCLWYVGFDTIFMPHKPAPWIALIAAPLIAILYFTFITKWQANTTKEKVAVLFGLLGGESLFGYFATSDNRTDHLAEIVLICILLPLLYLLYKRVNRSPSIEV
jgi:hypothetical protein